MLTEVSVQIGLKYRIYNTMQEVKYIDKEMQFLFNVFLLHLLTFKTNKNPYRLGDVAKLTKQWKVTVLSII